MAVRYIWLDYARYCVEQICRNRMPLNALKDQGTFKYELSCLLCRYHESGELFQSVTRGHGPLTRYVKLQVAHAPGMPGTFSPPPRVSDPDMHHGTCVTHVPWCMLGSLTCGFLWSRWRGKRSRHSRRMRNPQFYLSGKRPIEIGIMQFPLDSYI